MAMRRRRRRRSIKPCLMMTEILLVVAVDEPVEGQLDFGPSLPNLTLHPK
jgi:hypothetical protein